MTVWHQCHLQGLRVDLDMTQITVYCSSEAKDSPKERAGKIAIPVYEVYWHFETMDIVKKLGQPIAQSALRKFIQDGPQLKGTTFSPMRGLPPISNRLFAFTHVHFEDLLSLKSFQGCFFVY